MQSILFLEDVGMSGENKITYYKFKRNTKGKNDKTLSYITIRFINKETGERKDVRLSKLKKEIGDTKNFMPSNTFEVDRVVKKAIEMGVAPFSEIEENDTSLLEYIKSFWNFDKSEYILANAIIDRLVHHSYIIKITGQSHRIKGKLLYEEDNVEH